MDEVQGRFHSPVGVVGSSTNVSGWPMSVAVRRREARTMSKSRMRRKIRRIIYD
jgi:hypothetical protein